MEEDKTEGLHLQGTKHNTGTEVTSASYKNYNLEIISIYFL